MSKKILIILMTIVTLSGILGSTAESVSANSFTTRKYYVRSNIVAEGLTQWRNHVRKCMGV